MAETEEKKPAAAPDGPKGRKKPRKGKTRELVECLLVAGVLALGIRTFAFQIFKIPTRSMEPMLIGNEDYGDRVVAGMWYNRGGSFLPLKLAKPDRWQVIVFDHFILDEKGRKQRTNFIKRLVGLPGERLEIRDGDIWTARDGAEARIERKPARVQERLWIPLCDLSFAETWRVPYYWKSAGTVKLAGGAAELESGAEPAALSWTVPERIDNRFIRPTAREVKCPNCGEKFRAAFDTARPMAFCPKPACRAVDGSPGSRPSGAVWGVYDDGSEGELIKDTGGGNSKISNYWAEGKTSPPVSDLRLALDFESRNGAGRLEVLLTGRGELYRFELDLAGGEARLIGPRPDIRDVRKVSPLGPGRHRLEVVNVDGVFRAELDGKEVGLCPYDPDAKLARKHSGAEFSASGGARVSVYRARLWRDIYYGCFGGEMHPCDPGPNSTYIDIPEKMYLFLGDNQLASSDGRAFGLKPEKSIVARAAFVLWPASRWHVVW